MKGLDELMKSIQQEKPYDAVDPPVAPVESAAIGGDGGFSNDLSSVWDALSGMSNCINDTADFLTEIDENPRLRSSANLRTMSRVRSELEKIPEDTSLHNPVVLQLQDVVILMNQLMSRMR